MWCAIFRINYLFLTLSTLSYCSNVTFPLPFISVFTLTILYIDKQCDKNDDSAKTDESVCAVCGQPYVHPVELPCNHIFCYLCVKGVLARKPSCPFCRASVPRDFALKPKVVEPSLVETAVTSKADDKPQWFYEGRRDGWWLYDPRTTEEIEAAYKDKKTKCIVQVAGFNYIIDFDKMVQFREDRPERRRKILRNDKVDSATVVKGVAGLYSQK